MSRRKDSNAKILHHLAHKEMSAFDVLDARVVFRIIREIASARGLSKYQHVCTRKVELQSRYLNAHFEHFTALSIQKK